MKEDKNKTSIKELKRTTKIMYDEDDKDINYKERPLITNFVVYILYYIYSHDD